MADQLKVNSIFVDNESYQVQTITLGSKIFVSENKVRSIGPNSSFQLGRFKERKFPKHC